MDLKDESWSETGPPEGCYMKKILLAYDGTPAAERALETAAELARLSGSPVTVVGVVPPVPYGSELYPVFVEGPDDLRLALEGARDTLLARGVDATVREYEGDPAGTIEHLADVDGADVIVVGSRGRSALRRLFGGSVSAHVAAHARETVVVAR